MLVETAVGFTVELLFDGPPVLTWLTETSFRALDRERANTERMVLSVMLDVLIVAAEAEPIVRSVSAVATAALTLRGEM